MPARILAALLAVTALVVAGCGSSSKPSSSSTTTTTKSTTTAAKAPTKETLPPGDIPDNIAYVAFHSPDGYLIKVPESFSRSTQGGGATFTDKLNTIKVESQPAKSAPTTATAKTTFVPNAQASAKGFKLVKIDTVTRSAGKAVRIVYQAESAPNAVTGKTRPNTFEEYLFFHNGRLVILTLSGPTTADNVDPWKLVSGSLRYTK
jgi:hypothetical protein